MFKYNGTEDDAAITLVSFCSIAFISRWFSECQFEIRYLRQIAFCDVCSGVQ